MLHTSPEGSLCTSTSRPPKGLLLLLNLCLALCLGLCLCLSLCLCRLCLTLCLSLLLSWLSDVDPDTTTPSMMVLGGVLRRCST